jgi:predicted porin
MKRPLFIAALATLAAGTAVAQSNITIYGRLNASVEAQEDGDDSTTVLQNNASRIGVRGSEDLGAGLKAFFLIEHGFNVDTGAQTGSAFWGRESNIGIEYFWGRLRLGNMGSTAAYYATADYVSMHNHDTGTSSDAFYLYPGNVTNNIAYATPDFGGFVGEIQYGFKEGGTEDSLVLAGNYDAGPLHLGISYVDGPVDLSALSVPAVPTGAPAYSEGTEFGIRGLYEIGAFTLGGYYMYNTAENGAGSELKRDSFRLSGMYAAGLHEFHLNLGWANKVKVNGTSADGTDAMQYTLAYNYLLSKRTKVFAFYTAVDNKDNINYFSSAPGNDFSSFAVGVRHNF